MQYDVIASDVSIKHTYSLKTIKLVTTSFTYFSAVLNKYSVLNSNDNMNTITGDVRLITAATVHVNATGNSVAHNTQKSHSPWRVY